MNNLWIVAALVLSLGCHDHGHAMPEHDAAVTEAAIAVPIAPGQTAAWQAALEDLTGPRYAEYEASRKRFGLTSQTTFLQKTPMGDFAVIHLTGHDVRASFHAMSSSQDEWDVKWRALTKSLHGFDFATGERVMPRVEPLFETASSAPTDAKPFMFLAPLAAGARERLLSIKAELTGPRHADYIRARERIGVRREAVFFESAAMGDAIVVFWLADDPRASLDKLAASSDPFDVWLRAAIADAHPIGLDALAKIAAGNSLVAQYPRARI